MITCVYCGTGNPNLTRFCMGCGETLPRASRATAISRSWDIYALLAVVLAGSAIIVLVAYLDRG